MAISTKNVGTGGSGSIPKTLQPGNKVIKINKVYLDRVPWSDTGYNLMFDCEGPDLGDNFEGFFLDKTNESAGRYKGQVGRVRASRWVYEDKEIGDMTISRDLEIVKFLKNICDATECSKWFQDADGKFDTIEEFVEQLDKDKPFEGKFISACLAGKEYENKDGYTNHDLFFPKFSRNGVPFESENVEESISRVFTFNEAEHIVGKPKAVEGFSNGSSEDDASWLDE